MKFQSRLALAAAGLLTIALSTPASAYHLGGVAECDGCHTMHNSRNGAAMAINGGTGPYQSYQYLLQGSDQSSTCLNCHGRTTAGGYRVFHIGVATGVAPGNMTPGGDFAWLQKTFNWTIPGRGSYQEDGFSHGHNIVAADFGLTADARLTTAPGGGYAASALSCISCHDPHGRYRHLSTGGIAITGQPIKASGSYGEPTTDGNAVGVYRLLGGVGYAPQSYALYPFTNPSPTAVVPSTYNRTEAATDTRVAYGSGMSEWCANCHTNIHNNSYPGQLRHPAGNSAALGGVMAGNYNRYVKSGDMTGDIATSFTSLVPFEKGTTDRSILRTLAVNDGSQTGGPVSTDNVMCLSCHRAHASGFESMMRWNMEIELLVVNGAYPGSDSTNTEAAEAKWHMGRTVAETQGAYNNRPATRFATYQRSLCNKCHAKD